MGSEYKLIEGVEVVESSNEFKIALESADGWHYSRKFSTEELVDAALKALQVASWWSDPEKVRERALDFIQKEIF